MFNLLKMKFQNLNRNFLFLFEMIIFQYFQFEISNRFNNAIVYCSTLKVILSINMMIFFVNLFVIDMTISMSSSIFDKVKVKFKIII